MGYFYYKSVKNSYHEDKSNKPSIIRLMPQGQVKHSTSLLQCYIYTVFTPPASSLLVKIDINVPLIDCF